MRLFKDIPAPTLQERYDQHELILANAGALGLKHGEVAVLLTVLQVGLYASVSAIANQLGDGPRTISRIKHSLMMKGLVRFFPRYEPDGTQLSDFWDLSPLEERLIQLNPNLYLEE